MSQKRCEMCKEDVAILHQMPLMKICNNCYHLEMDAWKKNTEAEKERIRQENRAMGVNPVD